MLTNTKNIKKHLRYASKLANYLDASKHDWHLNKKIDYNDECPLMNFEYEGDRTVLFELITRENISLYNASKNHRITVYDSYILAYNFYLEIVLSDINSFDITELMDEKIDIAIDIWNKSPNHVEKMFYLVFGDKKCGSCTFETSLSITMNEHTIEDVKMLFVKASLDYNRKIIATEYFESIFGYKDNEFYLKSHKNLEK